MNTFIATSIFDIFKIGPGPSSSHTIGPMKAALAFRRSLERLSADILAQVDSLDVALYGSLSATGLGHGTHKAVLGGLLGWTPEGCDADRLLALFAKEGAEYEIVIGGCKISFRAENIRFAGAGERLHYQNTLLFTARGGGRDIQTGEYYSIGGGFILEKGERARCPPELPYPYSNMNDLRRLVEERHCSLDDIILANEEKLADRSRSEIQAGLDRILSAMLESVKNGLAVDGVLPGPIGLKRKARALHRHSRAVSDSHDRFLAALNAYTLAASEENAAGRKVVTAPTSGSAGVLPGIAALLHRHFKLPRKELRKGLVAAAAIAFVARHNASIAGAEVGCQGEVGVASAMAAAFMTHVHGGSIRQMENSAEIALEHHLGLTCDPVDGYVQIPCIERNALGAVSAYNAYILAMVGDPLRQKVSFDQVVEAMRITGKEMSKKYKETAEGGLAVCTVHC